MQPECCVSALARAERLANRNLLVCAAGRERGFRGATLPPPALPREHRRDVGARAGAAEPPVYYWALQYPRKNRSGPRANVFAERAQRNQDGPERAQRNQDGPERAAERVRSISFCKHR